MEMSAEGPGKEREGRPERGRPEGGRPEGEGGRREREAGVRGRPEPEGGGKVRSRPSNDVCAQKLTLPCFSNIFSLYNMRILYNILIRGRECGKG